eukprot:GFUD01026328.1.p1 GENE.GFUD01026328.1~~GFUD01026328.1.p1  ORF type:complete len:1070 (+),score=218.12 GFUD01026328.1:113-3322(+)
MRRRLDKSDMSGHEKIPLVGVRQVNGAFFRAGSCLGDPKTSALECVAREDLVGLTGVLADVCPIDDDADHENVDEYPLPAEHWINIPLGKEGGYKSLLHLGLESGNPDIVRLLVTAGARADQHNDDLGLSPVHVACKQASIVLLKILMENPKNKANVNAMMRNGRTGLHIAAENGKLDLLQYLLSCKDLDNVDSEDLMGRQTPVYLAAKNKKSEAVRILIEHGASLRNTVENKTLQQYLKEKMPYFDPDAVGIKVKPKESSEQDLLYSAGKLLDKAQLAKRRGNSNSQNLVFFRTLIQNLAFTNKVVLDTFNTGGMTLFQKSCDYGLEEFAQVLLEYGVDPNETLKENTTKAVLLAAYSGHAEVLNVLLDHKRESVDIVKVTKFDVQDSHSRETTLHYILKMPKRSEKKEKSNHYQKCFDLLFQDSGSVLQTELDKIINKRDMEGNSALHYATQSWSQNTVRKLLEKGANIGLKNNWEETPISKIKPETMEDFLDNYCLTSKNDIHQEDFELNLKYSFIAPPVDNPNFDETDPEGQKYIENQAYPETETLWYMAQSKPHRHLLKHPVITSFLWMKWQRIRKQFNRNLRLYLLFVMTLTWYIFERFGGVSLRKEDPSENGDPEESFCSVKRLGSDMSIGFWYAAFLIQSLCQFLMILRDWRRDLRESNWKIALQVFFTSWLEYMIITIIFVLLIFQAKAMFIVLTILLVLVSFREGLQMMVSLKRYVFGAENWLELITISLVGILLYVPDSSFEDPCETKRHLAAIAIVLSWATLITLVGRHPKLSRYNIYVTMFYKILETFVTFLIWYSFFLIAFSLGFYIMLHQDVPNKPPPSEDDYKFFNNPWWSFVKTATMFVGEIEFSDIPIDLDNGLWPLGYMYLLTFIFLIVVVLMNLLNGLAVSDTAVIREKAEIVTYIIRVETISCFEAVLLGDPFNFLSNWPAIKILKDVPSFAFCKTLYRNALIRDISHKITGATGILLFYSWLPEKKLKLTPNKTNQLCHCFATETMGQEIIESAKAIVVKKNQEALAEDNSEIAERIRNMEKNQEMIQNQILDIGTKMEMILMALKN